MRPDERALIGADQPTEHGPLRLRLVRLGTAVRRERFDYQGPIKNLGVADSLATSSSRFNFDGAHGVKASVAVLVCAVCVCLLTPSTAAASVDDVAATRAYLRAGYAYERSLKREAPVGEAVLEASASRIAGECPSALTYAPRDEAFGGIDGEIYATLVNAYWLGTPTLRAATLRFVGEIAHLRWSNRRLTRLVHAEDAEERADTTIVPPDVCADINAWKESSYATLPPDAMRFLARMSRIEALSFVGFTEESREAIIRRLLRRFEGAKERAEAKRLARLAASVDARAAAVKASARKKLATALGVPFL